MTIAIICDYDNETVIRKERGYFYFEIIEKGGNQLDVCKGCMKKVVAISDPERFESIRRVTWGLMKFETPYQKMQCQWIIQPGEYIIDTWDGKLCINDTPGELAKCPKCDQMYCLIFHFHKHLDTHYE